MTDELKAIGYDNISLISVSIQSCVVRAFDVKKGLRCVIKGIRIKYKNTYFKDVNEDI